MDAIVQSKLYFSDNYIVHVLRACSLFIYWKGVEAAGLSPLFYFVFLTINVLGVQGACTGMDTFGLVIRQVQIAAKSSTSEIKTTPVIPQNNLDCMLQYL